tara:strand:+ start:4772 stop:6790 length:2019 start_codon:yes stop_codon:yes gene_type:complete
MTHLWFVENRLQAKWIRENIQDVVDGIVVALTAEALQSLQEFGIKHTPVSEYADTRPVAAANQQLVVDCLDTLEEIETYILSHYTDSNATDVGFLTSNCYWLQYALTILVTRAHLIQETIRACSPVTVSIFKVAGDTDYAIKAAHIWYQSLSMSHVLEQLASKYMFQLDIRSYNAESVNRYNLLSSLHSIKQIPASLRKFVGERISYLDSSKFENTNNSGQNDKCSLLIVGGLNAEWKSVTSFDRDLQVYLLNWMNNMEFAREPGSRGWCMGYDPKVVQFENESSIKLTLDPYSLAQEEMDSVNIICDRWANNVNRKSSVCFQGLDLADDLIDVVRPIAARTLSLCRYLDNFVSQVLDAIAPDIVCFQGVIHMADKRMASACRNRGIPTVGIQHGGSVGTHMNHKMDINDWGYCDYYLTYGDGIKGYINPIVTQRSSLVSVGSTYIEQRMRTNNLEDHTDNTYVNVLWISEKSFGNTIGHHYFPEDTRRYLLQQRCLKILNNGNNVKVTFRPFRTNKETIGTVRWLERGEYKAIKVDINSDLEELIRMSDVIITDNAASTVWNEAIAFGKPLILFCDPQQTLLMPHFASDLEEACFWCKTDSELRNAVQRLSDTGSEFLSDLRRIDTTSYLENYVLYRNDGNSKQRAAGFLKSLCSQGPSADKLTKKLQEVM